VDQSSSEFDEAIGRAIAVCLGLSGIFVFIFQSYIFLRHGDFFLFSLIDAMEIINRFVYFAGDWVSNPKDWKGLHLIMSWVPLAPVLFLSGWYIAYDEI
jgi:hypothetical protein